MDNYVLRIYRREKNNPAAVTGTVEEVGKEREEGKKVFNNIEELWEILKKEAG